MRKWIHKLEALLWRQGISHPVILPLLRNEFCAVIAVLLCGIALLPWTLWPLSFGLGLLCMAWILWAWARFFFRVPLGEYSSAFLRAVLLNWLVRLMIVAILLYCALAIFKISALALLAGLASGLGLALLSFFCYSHVVKCSTASLKD